MPELHNPFDALLDRINREVDFDAPVRERQRQASELERGRHEKQEKQEKEEAEKFRQEEAERRKLLEKPFKINITYGEPDKERVYVISGGHVGPLTNEKLERSFYRMTANRLAAGLRERGLASWEVVSHNTQIEVFPYEIDKNDKMILAKPLPEQDFLLRDALAEAVQYYSDLFKGADVAEAVERKH